MFNITKSIALLIGVSMMVAPTILIAQDMQSFSEREELEAIDEHVQALKSEVIQINHELSLLEEKLLYPSTTQITVFVSSRSAFAVDSVQLTLNNEIVSNHIYTFRELEALQKGGVQRLYTGNVASGDHQIGVVIRGHSEGKLIEKIVVHNFKKEIDPKFIELQITGTERQPEISLKDW